LEYDASRTREKKRGTLRDGTRGIGGTNISGEFFFIFVEHVLILQIVVYIYENVMINFSQSNTPCIRRRNNKEVEQRKGGGGSEGGKKRAGGRKVKDINTMATGEEVELWGGHKIMLSELRSAALICSTLCCCMHPPHM
jgi:hypothetical protein